MPSVVLKVLIGARTALQQVCVSVCVYVCSRLRSSGVRSCCYPQWLLSNGILGILDEKNLSPRIWAEYRSASVAAAVGKELKACKTEESLNGA